MRLTEFSVLGYGTSDLSFDSPLNMGSFNLFYGPNEAGKSLMQDALLKFLLDEKAGVSAPGTRETLFRNIDRVDEYPEGFARLELGEENPKLPEKGTLPELTEKTTGVHSISPADFRNVFVVRNSRLEPSRHYGPDYYGNVTERLTGLRTSTLESVRDELEALGPLTNNTSEARLSNDAGDDKLKERYELAGTLLDEIHELRDRAESEELFLREKELYEARRERSRVEERLDTLEKAQATREYRAGRDELDRLREIRDELEEYESLSEEEYERWRSEKRRIDETEATIESREEEIAEIDGKLEEQEEPIREKERTLENLRDVRETIRDVVEPLVAEAETLEEQRAGNEPLESFHRWAFVLSGLALVGSLPVAYLREMPGDVYYPPVFLALSLLFGFLNYRVLRRRSRYEKTMRRIINKLAPYDLDADSPGEVQSNLESFAERIDGLEDELERLRNERKELTSRRTTLREQVAEELRPDVEAARREVQKLQRASGLDSLEEYERKLREKNEREETLRDSVNVLVTRFGGEELDREEQLEHWENALRDREWAADDVPEEEYDEEELGRLRDRREELSERIDTLSEQRESIRKDLRTIREQLREVLGPADRPVPECRALSDLEAVEEALADFRSEVEKNRDAALEAIGIFESLETEEREKIRDLFGSESDVSRHFEAVTGGSFTSVNYDPEGNDLHGRTPNDEVYDPEQLSGGTYDQLYFAIRLGLGESLLHGSPGFFLLDDPFIKSDDDRLDREFDLLERIVDSGWQILYFSAKSEVLERVEAMAERVIFRKGEDF